MHHTAAGQGRTGQGMWHGTAAEALLPALLPCPSSEGALFHTGTHRTTQTHVNERGSLPQPLLWTHPDPDPDPDPGRLALTDRARSFCGGDMAKEKPLAEGSSLPSLLRPRWAGRFEAAAAAARHTPANREKRTRNKEQRTVNRDRWRGRATYPRRTRPARLGAARSLPVPLAASPAARPLYRDCPPAPERDDRTVTRAVTGQGDVTVGVLYCKDIIVRQGTCLLLRPALLRQAAQLCLHGGGSLTAPLQLRAGRGQLCHQTM